MGGHINRILGNEKNVRREQILCVLPGSPLLVPGACALAQPRESDLTPTAAESALRVCCSTQSQPATSTPGQSSAAGTPSEPTQSAADPAPSSQAGTSAKRQPKRILGVMPNYRAVSAGEIPPPPTPKEAFKIATQNSFDYSPSRILIMPDYHGHNSFDASEVLGRGISQGVSAAYFPSHDRTLGALAVKLWIRHGARRPH